jgi:hypothetical protein
MSHNRILEPKLFIVPTLGACMEDVSGLTDAAIDMMLLGVTYNNARRNLAEVTI